MAPSQHDGVFLLISHFFGKTSILKSVSVFPSQFIETYACCFLPSFATSVTFCADAFTFKKQPFAQSKTAFSIGSVKLPKPESIASVNTRLPVTTRFISY